MRKPQALSRIAALGLAAVTLLTSGCAVLVNDHGTGGGPYRDVELVFGVQGNAAQKLKDSTSGVPIAGEVARNITGHQMYVDEQGRTVLTYPQQPTSTVYCGWQKTDCPWPYQNPDTGFFLQEAPATVVGPKCPDGYNLTRLDFEKSPTLLICDKGTSGGQRYVPPSMIVESGDGVRVYTPQCPSNRNLVGALNRGAIVNRDLQGAGTCVPKQALP